MAKRWPGLGKWVALAGLTLLAPGMALADPPAAPQPLASVHITCTRKDFEALSLAWYRRTLGEAYDRLGRHDVAGDQEARKYLDLLASYLAATPDHCTPEQLLAAARPVMDAHGDDPLLLYATARALELSGSPNAAVPYLQAAVDGFQTVNYPRQQAWQAAARLAVLAPKAGLPANPETNGLAVQWFTTAVQEQLPPGQERAFLAAVRRQVAPGGYRGLDKLVYTLAPQPGPNQWVLQVLAGDQEIQDGWAARGTGWASSVTAEGWKKLTECVAQAARDYEAAYALHPEFPEAPTGMITETMGSEDSSPEMERMWFDRAVAAQIDWVPAYDKLAYGSSPRWGGSLELMRALADECLAVPRYDTDVPSNYFYVLKRIAVEEDQRGIWQEPGVYSNLKKVFEGLIAAPEHAAEVPVWATRYAAIAYLTGNLPDAAQAFRLAGPRVDEHVFQELTKQTISQVRPQVPGAGGP